MKRIILFVLVFATVMTISGCDQKKTGTSSTTYVMKITGNHLTLSTDDGKEYSFKMEDDVLIFDAGNSSEIPSYKSFETPADNTIFELSN